MPKAKFKTKGSRFHLQSRKNNLYKEKEYLDEEYNSRGYEHSSQERSTSRKRSSKSLTPGHFEQFEKKRFKVENEEFATRKEDIMVPDQFVAKLLGSHGRNLNRIREICGHGTYINLSGPGDVDCKGRRLLTIEGSEISIEKAKEELWKTLQDIGVDLQALRPSQEPRIRVTFNDTVDYPVYEDLEVGRKVVETSSEVKEESFTSR